jgi:dUTP pyrophosphatase
MFIKIYFKKFAPDVVLPKYETPGSAGFDVRAYFKEPILRQTGVTVLPGHSAVFDTGLSPEIAEGYELEFRPRSGLAFKNDVTLSNSPGTIDSDYRGEMRIKLINHGKTSFVVNHGDRIAQALLKEARQAIILETEELSETLRGEGGYGSTGLS